MEAQIPAEGISKQQDFGHSQLYAIPCQCSNPDDEITMEIEVTDYYGGAKHANVPLEVAVHIWVKTKTAYWKKTFETNDGPYDWRYNVKDFANDWINRARIIWVALTKGYVEMEAWTMLTEQQAVNLAGTIERGCKEVRAWEKPGQKSHSGSND